MSTVGGSCLCGDVAWEVDPPLEFMSHCHCSRCRKAHGVAFSTYVLCRPEAFRLIRGRERIRHHRSSPGLTRPFCGRCGSVVADGEAFQGLVGTPVGSLDGDPGTRPVAHIFVGSKAPWFEIHDEVPRFDSFPPGYDGPTLADRPLSDPATGAVRGSCLCGGVAYEVTGPATRCWACHCARCRKARSAAHATNLFTSPDGVRFTRGEDLLDSYKVPEAKFFTQVFCRACGSPMPRASRERGIAVVPMGTLDDDPGARLQRHIFTAWKAPWYEIADSLPQDAEYPPGM